MTNYQQVCINSAGVAQTPGWTIDTFGNDCGGWCVIRTDGHPGPKYEVEDIRDAVSELGYLVADADTIWAVRFTPTSANDVIERGHS